MRSRGMLMLFIAAIAGLAAVLLAARWLQLQGGEKGRIAVANTEVELGSRITPEMIRMVDWPQGSVPPGAFITPAELEGRVVRTSLLRGEPFLDAKLAPVGTKGGLSAVVPEGKRAMTVRVNDVIGVAGFALPGTYVDVMVNTQEEGSNRRDGDHSISKIVLERILVLAVAQEADRDTTKPKVVNAVTLELTPREAEILDLARSVGTLSLVLRNQTDPRVADSNGATKSVLLNGVRHIVETKPVSTRRASKPRRSAPTPAVAAAPSPQHCVELIRGVTKTTECF